MNNIWKWEKLTRTQEHEYTYERHRENMQLLNKPLWWLPRIYIEATKIRLCLTFKHIDERQLHVIPGY